MDDYLSKPVNLEELKALLSRHLKALQTIRTKPLDR
jgi:DNA-binding response OmpR family regulator